MKKTLSRILLTLAVLAAIPILFFVVRRALAAREIERESQNVPAQAPQLAVTSRLEILPLYEAASLDEGYIGGHGVSYLIRTDSATILMDVGDNPGKLAPAPFDQNMQALGIGWDEIDALVISHLHPDHLGGVDAWRQNTIALGDAAEAAGDLPVYVPSPMKFPGAILATEPASISPDAATTGAVPYLELFPVSLFTPKGGEQALVVNVAGQGLVLITGCGHPTLERLVARAEALYGQPVIGVVGGLHYLEADAQTLAAHIQFLQSRQPRLVALSPHDSGPGVLAAFRSAFPQAYQEVSIGSAIQFPKP